MQVSVASEPIKSGSPNLDWVGATDRVAIVLDGLTEGAATGCIHGTSWYVHQLGIRLLHLAGGSDEISLAASLSRAIGEAADHAITGTVQNARCALLASDGAALLVTDFHELTWEQLLQLGYAEGPQAIITATRKAEASDPDRIKWPRYKVSDDATAAVCRMGELL